jgi:hypothetical protein
MKPWRQCGAGNKGGGPPSRRPKRHNPMKTYDILQSGKRGIPLGGRRRYGQ